MVRIMKSNSVVFSLIVAFVSVVGLEVVEWRSKVNEVDTSQVQGVSRVEETLDSQQNSEVLTLPEEFFDPTTYFSSVKAHQAKTGGEQSRRIVAGVVPHHLVASDMIADFFSSLSEQKVTTLILIGPNHYETGSNLVISGTQAVRTQFGDTYPDTDLITRLQELSFVSVENNVVQADHAIGSHIPFLQHYLPQTRIVPLLISARMNKDDIEQLAFALARQLHNEEIVLLASVDFSHYLPLRVSEEKDRETLTLMEQHNYNRLLSLGDDHADSPASIVTLLRTMEILGNTGFEVRDHSNSAIILGEDVPSTTSYFELIFADN